MNTLNSQKSLGFVLPICLVLFLILGGLSSCKANDQHLIAVEQALQIESKNPIVTVQILENNLYKVRDKQVIPLLLNYLETIKHDKTIYSSGLGLVVTYLSQVTGLEAHVDHNFIGTMYNNEETWMQDIQQWQSWWDVNKDYIAWDDRSGMLKVMPH